MYPELRPRSFIITIWNTTAIIMKLRSQCYYYYSHEPWLAYLSSYLHSTSRMKTLACLKDLTSACMSVPLIFPPALGMLYFSCSCISKLLTDWKIQPLYPLIGHMFFLSFASGQNLLRNSQ